MFGRGAQPLRHTVTRVLRSQAVAEWGAAIANCGVVNMASQGHTTTSNIAKAS